MDDDPVPALLSYRQRRRQRLWHSRIRKLGWVAGLVLTTALIGGAFGIYQRSQLPSPIAAMTLSPPKDLWIPGTWETEARAYLDRHAYDDVSSATPPPHRPQHHVPHRHVQSRSAAP